MLIGKPAFFDLEPASVKVVVAAYTERRGKFVGVRGVDDKAGLQFGKQSDVVGDVVLGRR